MTGSKLADAQAAYESANTLWPAMAAGVNFMLYAAGWLEGGLVSSYDKFVMDCDQLAAHQKMAGGVDMSETGQPLSGLHPYVRKFPDGVPRFQYRRQQFLQVMGNGGIAPGEQRANAVARQWLERYEQPELDPGIDEALEDFMRRRKDFMPDAFT